MFIGKEQEAQEMQSLNRPRKVEVETPKEDLVLAEAATEEVEVLTTA